MPLTDLPLEELRGYRPEAAEPDGFDDFWAGTLAAARSAAAAGGQAGAGAARYEPVADSPLRTVEAYDVRFPGWDGQPVAAWLLLPRAAEGPLPAVVTYIGYGGGRGLHTDRLLFSAAGYAHLVVDSRGQGDDTPDPDPVPAPHYVGGFLSRGVQHPDHYYYRRLVADCVRAVDALAAHPAVDPSRIVVSGASQGGGLALAVAALAGEAVAAALVDVPFLCHMRRGSEIATAGPYPELVQYLGVHQRMAPDEAFATLDYFDGLHFAPRATAPALFSVGLMDPVCPPSTVFAAYNRYAGADKDISVWPYGDHAGGRGAQGPRQLAWLAARGLAPGGGPA